MDNNSNDDTIYALRAEIEALRQTSVLEKKELARMARENRTLRESESKLQAMIEKIPEAFQSLDVHGNLLSVNDKWCEVLGYTKEEVIGRGFDSFLTSKSQKSYIEYFAVFKATGRISNAEFKMLKKDEEAIDVSFDGVIVYNDKGEISHTECVFTNITEQKNIQDALQESENRFRDLYNNSPDIYVSVSPKDSSVLICNDTLLNKTGYTREEIIGQPVFKLYHEDALEGAKKAFKQFVDTGSVIDFPLILKKKDGSKIDVDLNVSAVRDEEGKIIYSISSWRDTTQIHKIEHKYQNLLSNMEVGVVIHASDTSIIYSNPLASKLLHLSNESMLNVTAADPNWIFLNEKGDSLPLEEYPVNRILKAKSPVKNMTVGIVHEKTNSRRWMLVNGYPVFDHDGSLIEVVISFSDITQRVEVEIAVNNSEMKIQSILNTAPVGIGMLINNFIKEGNNKFFTMLGYSKEELNGKHIASLYISEEEFKCVNEEEYTQIRLKGSSSVETQIKKKNGDLIDIILSSTPLDITDMSKGLTFSVLDITEQKEIKNNLQIEKNRFQKAERIANIGSWEQNFIVGTLEWSDEVHRIFEIDIAHKMTFDDFIKCVHPEDRESINQAFQASVQEHKHYHLIHRLLFPDQRIKYVLEHAKHFFDTNNNHLYTIGTVQDITTQVEMENKLKISNDKFEKAFNKTPNLIILSNQKTGKIYEINKTFEHIIGYTREELIGHTSFDINIWKNLDDRKIYLDSLTKDGSIENTIFSFNKKNGEEVIANVFGSIVEIDNESYILTVADDITEQRRAEKEVKNRDTLISSIFQVIPDILFIMRPDGVIIDYRAQTDDKLYISPQQFIHRNMQDVLPPDIGKMFNQNIKALSQDSNIKIFEYELEVSDEKRYFEARMAQLPLEKNIMTIIRDITELKKKDKMLIGQSRLAAMGEMIGMIAHQWRQPLSVIAMHANNILLDIELSELDTIDFKDYSNSILNQTLHLSNTIDDFRNYFKPDKSPSKVKVKEVLDETYNIVRDSLLNNNITFQISCTSESVVDAYPRELMQVFVNIITNAKDALLEEKSDDAYIDIKVFEDNEYVTTEICNNGASIDNSIITKIFDPYFSTKDEKTGTGLGLYMSKMIIEDHLQGNLEVSNNEQGVCFKVQLNKTQNV